MNLMPSIPNYQNKAQLQYMRIWGYASVFNIKDWQGDIILPGAFTKSIKSWRKLRRLPLLLWQHNARQVIGYCSKIMEDKNGLFIEGSLLLSLPHTRKAALNINAGKARSLSIGFVPEVYHKDHKSGLRSIAQAKLLEISLVFKGANHLCKLYG